MTGWEEVRRQLAISGRVTDARTGRPVPGAAVALDGSVAVHTAADGHYHILDLADGSYTLTASLPAAGSRYGSTSANVTVARRADGDLAGAIADLQLPSTAVSGRVTVAGTALAGATMAVGGSGERTLTDHAGRYLLAGLEAGERRVAVMAPGGGRLVREIALAEAGAHSTVDFELDEDQPP
jgi:hypothetical protein